MEMREFKRNRLFSSKKKGMNLLLRPKKPQRHETKSAGKKKRDAMQKELTRRRPFLDLYP
jgi:hypothetical protein